MVPNFDGRLTRLGMEIGRVLMFSWHYPCKGLDLSRGLKIAKIKQAMSRTCSRWKQIRLGLSKGWLNTVSEEAALSQNVQDTRPPSKSVKSERPNRVDVHLQLRPNTPVQVANMHYYVKTCAVASNGNFDTITPDFPELRNRLVPWFLDFHFVLFDWIRSVIASARV